MGQIIEQSAFILCSMDCNILLVIFYHMIKIVFHLSVHVDKQLEEDTSLVSWRQVTQHGVYYTMASIINANKNVKYLAAIKRFTMPKYMLVSNYKSFIMFIYPTAAL